MDEVHEIISAVRENFRFLTLEVRKQLEATRAVIAEPRESAIKAIVTRDDYVDNLRSVIENKCYHLLGDARVERRSVDLVRAINTSTNNLERIADYCVNIVGQLGHLSAPKAFARFDVAPLFSEIAVARCSGR